MDDRVSALESWAFQTGRDLAAIKAVQAEHTETLADHTQRLEQIEQGIGLLLAHFGIEGSK